MTDDDLDGRLVAAGQRWRAGNPSIATVDVDALDLVELGAEPIGSDRRVRWLAAGVAAVVVAAIALALALVPDDSNPAPTDTGAAVLKNSHWALSAFSSADRAVSSPIGLGLSFTSDRVQADDSCNTLSGRVAVTDSSLRFGELASSAVGCAQSRTAQLATAVDAVLQGTVSWSVAGDALRISTPTGAYLIYARQDPTTGADPSKLVGAWQLSATVLDGRSSTPNPRSQLEVSASSLIVGVTCQPITFSAKLGQGSMITRQLAQFAATCPSGSPTDSPQLLILPGALLWTLDGDVLTLSKPGIGSLTYVRVGEGSAPLGMWAISEMNGRVVHLAGPLVMRADAYSVRYFCAIEVGALVVSGDKLSFNSPKTSQPVPCSSAADAADRQERAILSGPTTWHMSPDGLTIAKSRGTLTLHRVSGPEALPATLWRLTTIEQITNGATSARAALESEPPLIFVGGGDVRFGECVGSQVTIAATTMTFTQVWTDNGMTSCARLTVQDSTFVMGRLLQGTVSWLMTGDQLIITKPGVGRLVFELQA
jgi:heat shock protein HslJ